MEKDKRSFAPRYLGTVEVIPDHAEVVIIKGTITGMVRARQGDYVLAVKDGDTWLAGRVYQWSGVRWEYREPEQNTDLYIRCFKDGLDVPSLTQDMGWFGALFAKLLIVQQAFIETLEAQILKISGVIYGGDRFDANGDIINPDKHGWFLGSDGIFKATGGVFQGVSSGEFEGSVYGDNGTFNNLNVKSLSGAIEANSTIRGIPVNNLAVIQQAASPTSTDLPIGSIILARGNSSSTPINLNTLVQIVSSATKLQPSNAGLYEILGYESTESSNVKMPGQWRISGSIMESHYVSGGSSSYVCYYLCRRVS